MKHGTLANMHKVSYPGENAGRHLLKGVNEAFYKYRIQSLGSVSRLLISH